MAGYGGDPGRSVAGSIASNILWIVWGLHDRAYALVFLQVCLAATNVRGARKNDPNTAQPIRQH
jgi:hypothetical protein